MGEERLAMEANMLRCVAFLSMLVLSLAASPVPPADMAFQEDKIKIHLDMEALKCAKKCSLDCAVSLFSPVAYTGCFGLCMAACKLHKPIPGTEQATAGAAIAAEEAATGSGMQPTSDPTYDCTRNCANSMSRVMTTNAKLTLSKDTTPPTKPSVPELKHYAEGYVDSCSMACSMNNKLF